MADISYKYWDNEHRIDSYDNVVSTYEWIRDALRFVFEDRNNLTLNCVISFDSEDMSYECKSMAGRDATFPQRLRPHPRGVRGEAEGTDRGDEGRD